MADFEAGDKVVLNSINPTGWELDEAHGGIPTNWATKEGIEPTELYEVIWADWDSVEVGKFVHPPKKFALVLGEQNERL